MLEQMLMTALARCSCPQMERACAGRLLVLILASEPPEYHDLVVVHDLQEEYELLVWNRLVDLAASHMEIGCEVLADCIC